jgi:hypothetical protein
MSRILLIFISIIVLVSCKSNPLVGSWKPIKEHYKYIDTVTNIVTLDKDDTTSCSSKSLTSVYTKNGMFLLQDDSRQLNKILLSWKYKLSGDTILGAFPLTYNISNDTLTCIQTSILLGDTKAFITTVYVRKN